MSNGTGASQRLAAAVFPSVPRGRGHYESYYLRAVAPDRPAAVWIRYTVHKRPAAAPTGSVWCTLWDGERPRAVKETVAGPRFDESWIGIGESAIGPGRAVGRGLAGGHSASWKLRYSEGAGSVQHLPMQWLYWAPIPRTKTATLVSDSRFSGWVEVDGGRTGVERWRGMVGHNWGSEHAERWIWLHGLDFAQRPEAWLDCVVGRVRLAGRTTPWIANGMLSLGDERIRLGGLAGARKLRVEEQPTGARMVLPSSAGAVELEVSAPEGQTVAWIYADPAGGEHHSLHCSVAKMELELSGPGRQPLQLSSDHGGCYELGVRETDHGVPLQPFGL